MFILIDIDDYYDANFPINYQVLKQYSNINKMLIYIYVNHHVSQTYSS
jgi:hypothetical protein